jgi:hypothetical protein
MNNELRRIWKEQFVAPLMNYSGIFLERLGNTHHKISVKIASVSAEIQTEHLRNQNTLIEQWLSKCVPRAEGVCEV